MTDLILPPLVLKTGHLSDSAICLGFSRRVPEQTLGGIPQSLRQVTRINCILLPSWNPSSLQTTAASTVSQPLSQTVPHPPPKHISTRPSLLAEPLTRRTLDSVHWAPAVVRQCSACTSPSLTLQALFITPTVNVAGPPSATLHYYNKAQ